MLGQHTVLDPHHVGSHPCRGCSVTRKAAVDDDVVALRQNEAVLVAQLPERLRTSPSSPSRPGSMWALCWMYLSDQKRGCHSSGHRHVVWTASQPADRMGAE
jgi:hypothetical protein